MKKTIYLIGIAASIMGGITSCTLDAEAVSYTHLRAHET